MERNCNYYKCRRALASFTCSCVVRLHCQYELTYLTYELLLPVDHGSRNTCFHPVLSYAAVSIFFQLHLKPAVPRVSSPSLLRSPCFFLRPCGVHCSACLAELSSLLLNVCSSKFHFLRLTDPVLAPNRLLFTAF